MADLFTIQHIRGSYDNPESTYNTLQVLKAEVDFLVSLGVNSIRVDIGYDAFATSNTAIIANIDALVSYIRTKGVQFILADAAREYYRNHPEPWSQFKIDWESRVSALASRYTPDWYLVIKEPGWYVPMISDATSNPLVKSPTDWVALLDTLDTTVKGVSPPTKTGISTASGSLAGSNSSLYVQIMQQATTLASCDMLGFDIYGSSGLTNTVNYLNTNGVGAKALWIAECWNGATHNSGNPSTDASFLQTIYNSFPTMSMMSPFFSDDMCTYSLDSATNSNTILGYYQNNTMPSYTTYKSIISSITTPRPTTTTVTVAALV